MISRSFRCPPDKSFFIFGPRGVGKSFFIKKEYPNDLYINLLEAQVATSLVANPSRLESLIPTKYRGLVIIDEIQKIPSLLDEVHRLIEEKKYRFLLTGSSARKLRKSGVNLLAGRAYTQHAYPLTALELKERFDLQRALRSGLLPLAYLEKDYRKFLSSYVMTYLKEEVQQEGITRNIGQFARFLEAASFSQGQVLNFSQVGADCSVERKTVTNYFQVLEDLMLSYQLEVFSLRAKRELISHRKFYFFDVGVFHQIRPRGPLDVESEVLGASVETLILQELMARNEYQDWNYKIQYWHTKKHLEVDFILYGERGLKAIEVKSSSRIRDQDLLGLQEFKKDYPQADLILVYGGNTKKVYQDILWVPIEEFLLKTDKFV